MEVILKKDIDKLGFENEIISVKNGFGRNYLIPNGLAIIANVSSKRMLEETLKQRAHKEEKLVNEAESIAEKLENTVISVATKAGEKGKIFGSVNNIQIAKALKEQGFDIDRKNILLQDDHIKALGKYEATVRLYKHIEKKIAFEVIAEVE